MIDSIVEGAKQVTKILGKELPENSIIAKIDSIKRAVVGSEGVEKVTGEKARFDLLNLIGLEGEAKDIFGTTDIDSIIKEANTLMQRAQENLSTVAYNPYAPFKTIADSYNTPPLNEVINNLRGELTTRLNNPRGFVRKTIEELVEERNILSQLEDMPNFTKSALKRELSDSLIRLNLLEKSMLSNVGGLNPTAFAAKGKEIIGKLQASKSFTQEETNKVLKNFFTAHVKQNIKQIQAGETTIGLEVVMDKLLFEIQQMKNASRLIKTPTAESNGLKLMGEMFEDALNSNSPIKITARGIKSFTLQQLSAFVATNQQLRLITIPAEKQTDDMVRLIESLVSKNADLSVPTSRKFNG